MQFEMTSTVFGCTKVTVDGNTYCSMFTGQQPVGDNAGNTLGLDVTKISAEPSVFEQLKNESFKPGDSVKLVAMLKKAANGKSQPYIVGVVPGQQRAVADNQKKTG